MDVSTLIFTWLVIYSYSNTHICYAELADTSRGSCNEGWFNYSLINKCMPCSFICLTNEQLCRLYGCLEYLNKQCKPEECYQISNGNCIPSTGRAECKGTTPDPIPAPSNLEVIHSAAAAVTVKWLSESDGKSDLKSYVQYKKCTEEWDVASEVPQGRIPDRGLMKTARYEVTDLESNVCYDFRVRSCKIANSGSHTSVFSNVVNATTTPVGTTTTTIDASQDNSNKDNREDVGTSNPVAEKSSHAGGYLANIPAWVAYAFCGVVAAAAILVAA